MKNDRHYLGLFLLCALLVSFFCGKGCHLPKNNMTLKEAASRGDLEFVRKNVEAQVDINQRDWNGYTPLMIATYYNFHEIVVYLLENGADIDLQGKDGRTALILATCNMNTKMIKTLLKYNPNAGITDSGGYTAFDHAKNLNLKSISKLLENRNKE